MTKIIENLQQWDEEEKREAAMTPEKTPPVSVRRLDAKIDAFLDVLFTNGLGETADRLVLVQDVPGGKYRDLGGWGRKVIRVKLRALLNEVAP